MAIEYYKVRKRKNRNHRLYIYALIGIIVGIIIKSFFISTVTYNSHLYLYKKNTSSFSKGTKPVLLKVNNDYIFLKNQEITFQGKKLGFILITKKDIYGIIIRRIF